MNVHDRPLRFLKMHGLGNDFIFVFKEGQQEKPSEDVIIQMCDRNRGIGADQLLWVENFSGSTSATMHIYNPDGSIARACGNATRCLAYLYYKKFGKSDVTIHTPGGTIPCHVLNKDVVTIKLPPAKLGFDCVGGVGKFDPTEAQLTLPLIRELRYVNVGNCHAVHVVDELPSDEELISYGRWLNTSHRCFPQGINVEFIRFDTPNSAQMRVYERGSECITQACGTGACASVYAAFDAGTCAREVRVRLDGGDLRVGVLANNHLEMTGPVCYVYEGVYTNGCEIR